MDTAPDDPSPPERRRVRPLAWVAWGVLPVIIYPLSVGPACRLIRPHLVGKPVPSAFMSFYQPISLAMHTSTTAKSFFDWYLDLWDPEGHRTNPKKTPTTGH